MESNTVEEVITLDDLIADAKALAREGKYIEAGKMLRVLEGKFPESSETQFLLGACYAKIGRDDLAVQAWKKSCELAPNPRARAWLLRYEETDPTNFEISEDGSGAIAGDLEACWDPTA